MAGWDVLFDIIVMLAAALVLGMLAEWLKQSAILGYLLAGTLVGPNVLGFVSQGDHVRSIAELGVALLLFTIGLEFSFRRLRQLGRVALIGGSAQVLLTLVAGAAVSAAFGLSGRAAIAVGAMIALSSTACVLRLLVDRGAVEGMYGRNAMGILLAQDVAVIPLLLLIVVLRSGGSAAEAFGTLLRTVGLAMVLIASFVLLLNYVVPKVLDSERWSRNRELPILLAIVLAIGSAYAAHAAELSPAMGAFVAGVLLGESPFATQIRADVGSLRTVLVTLFFAAIGMLGDPAWIVGHWHLVAGVVVLVMVGKTLIVWGIVRSLGFPSGISAATGLCVAQVGEFSFVLAQTAHGPGGVIDDETFRLIVSVTIATLFLTPFAVMVAPSLADRIEARRRRRAGAPETDEPGGHAEEGPTEPGILVIGFGPAGQAVAEALYAQHKDHLGVIELSPRSAKAAQRLGLPVFRGDATQRDILEHAGVPGTRVIIVTVPDPVTARTIIEQCRQLAPDAVVVARSRYHMHRWEIQLAGAREVVDEEEQVGKRLAAIARRYVHAAKKTEQEPPADD